MRILARILGFIPLLVSVLVVVMLLIYKPEGYGLIVGVFAFVYLVVVPIMFFAVWRKVKRARELRLAATPNSGDGPTVAAQAKQY
jgi:hypothetical protein